MISIYASYSAINRIIVSFGVFKAFQDQGGNSICSAIAISIVIEWVAIPGSREKDLAQQNYPDW